MKFLIALSILASSTVFANNHRNEIRCYEPANQGRRGELAFILEERGMGDQVLHVVYPQGLPNPLRLNNEGCLEHPGQGQGPANELVLCRGEGQQVRKLVPIEATIGGGAPETVYCQKGILDWFSDDLM
jgi:hypothetical protein